MSEPTAHPWMANSVPALQAAMLAEIGAGSIADLFEQIPADHRLQRPLDLPPGLRSEAQLKRHLTTLLSRTEDCERNLSFLGAGCWQHHVPAVVDEIVGRYELLTNVWGSPQSDFGRNQAWFEYASQLGELVGMEVVSLPVYSWGCAAGHAIRMAARSRAGRGSAAANRRSGATGGDRQLLRAEPDEPAHRHGRGWPRSRHRPARPWRSRAPPVRPDRRGLPREPVLSGADRGQRCRVARLTHARGAAVVGADPISLGVLAGAGRVGRRHRRRADPAAGRAHALRRGRRRLHRPRDEERFVREYNGFLVSITGTAQARPVRLRPLLLAPDLLRHARAGQGLDRQLGLSLGHRQRRLSRPARPRGHARGRQAILQRASYAAQLLARAGREGPVRRLLQGVRRRLHRHRQIVAAINGALRAHRIFGGKDLSAEFPELGQIALYCVTEIHTQADIDRLVAAVAEACDDQAARVSRRRPGTSRWSCRWATRDGAGMMFPRSSPRSPCVGSGRDLVPAAMRRPIRPTCPNCPNPRCSGTICAWPGDAGDDEHQPLRHLHHEVPRRAAEQAVAAVSWPSCTRTSPRTRCRACWPLSTDST